MEKTKLFSTVPGELDSHIQNDRFGTLVYNTKQLTQRELNRYKIKSLKRTQSSFFITLLLERY